MVGSLMTVLSKTSMTSRWCLYLPKQSIHRSLFCDDDDAHEDDFDGDVFSSFLFSQLMHKTTMVTEKKPTKK
jgi:hypothetical protein